MLVDVIVPCFNEAPRLGGVLKTLSSSSYIKRIVVVDDGSTDNSSGIAKRFNKTTVIRLNKNVGKGIAVRKGLSKVNSKVVMLCDADLQGLTTKHIEDLIKTFFKYPKDLTVGFRNKGDNKLLYLLRRYLTLDMEGERVMRRDDLEKIASSPHASGFGLEAWTNYYFKKNGRTTHRVKLDGVYNPLMIRKRKNGVINYISELLTNFKTYLFIFKDRFSVSLSR